MRNTDSAFIPDEIFTLCLYDCFAYDTWNLRDALCLILGLNANLIDLSWPLDDQDPEAYITIKSYLPPNETEWVQRPEACGKRVPFVDSKDTHRSLEHYEYELNNLRRLWLSNPKHGSGRYAPKVFLEWALQKHISVPWLEWAIDNELIVEDELFSQDKIVKSASDVVPAKSWTVVLRIIAGLSHQYLEHPDEKDKQLSGLNKIIQVLSGVGMTVDAGKLSEYIIKARDLRIYEVEEQKKMAAMLIRKQKTATN